MIRITSLIIFDEGFFEVIHSISDNPVEARKEILETFNEEYGEDFKSIAELLNYYQSQEGKGAHLSVQELGILTTKTAIIQ